VQKVIAEHKDKENGSATSLENIDRTCGHFESAFRDGKWPKIEDYFSDSD
jgi:hypothetical protein